VRAFLFETVHAVHGSVGISTTADSSRRTFRLRKMVKTNVRHNPVKPCVKTAIKPERVNIPVDSQEGFLINVPRVLGRPQQFIASRKTLWS